MAKRRKALRIDPDKRLRDCLKPILLTKFQSTQSRVRKVISAADAVSLHKMRVSCRRLHAVLKIFQTCFPRKKYKAVYQILQNILESSGNVRECDVVVSTLEKFRSPRPDSESILLDMLLARKLFERRQLQEHLQHTLKELTRGKFKYYFLDLINTLS